jgi:xanthine dehydrogenase accessory factor
MSVEYPSDPEFLRWASDRLERGLSVAWITITKKSGSAPRGTGTKMLVDENGETIGTVGGGDAERKIVKAAQEALKERKPRTMKVAMFRESLFEDVVTTSQLCGGVIEVFIDVLKPLQRLLIVGAGHVARPLAKIGKMLGYKVVVIDNFPEYATKEKIPDADEIIVDKDIIKALEQVSVNKNDYMIIVHGDGDLEAAVLSYVFREKRIPRYLGLLSGKGKLAYILKKLLKEGIDPSLIRENLFSPAGLAIGSETPEEIAIAVLGEILRIDRGAEGVHENKTPFVLESVMSGGQRSERK